MEQPPTAKWYDNNLLVAVLCAFLFPIGLYALWKSPTRSKGWKVGGTIAVALLVIVALNSDDTKPKDKAPQPAAASKDTVPSDEPVAPSDTATSADQAAHSDQDLFLSEKINSFREYVLSEQVIQETSDAIGPFKSSSSKSTASFLAERQNRLVNWTARVISVDMDQSKECDISLSIISGEIVGSKQVAFKKMDCRITVEAIQATIKAIGSKGVVRSGDLYEAIKGLKENDEVVFSGKVTKAEENSEATGLNYSIVFYVELTGIRKR